MLKAIVTVVVVAALAFWSNPGPDVHRDKLKSEVAARSQLAAILQLGSLAAFASQYHTLGLASYSTLNGRTVSYGAFGLVFIPNIGSGSASP
jgi:hypothetical protein